MFTGAILGFYRLKNIIIFYPSDMTQTCRKNLHYRVHDMLGNN